MALLCLLLPNQISYPFSTQTKHTRKGCVCAVLMETDGMCGWDDRKKEPEKGQKSACALGCHVSITAEQSWSRWYPWLLESCVQELMQNVTFCTKDKGRCYSVWMFFLSSGKGALRNYLWEKHKPKKNRSSAHEQLIYISQLKCLFLFFQTCCFLLNSVYISIYLSVKTALILVS